MSKHHRLVIYPSNPLGTEDGVEVYVIGFLKNNPHMIKARDESGCVWYAGWDPEDESWHASRDAEDITG